MYYDVFILGCLLDGPRYGYEIKKLLSENLTACTVISNNSLYPILKKFQTMGATDKHVEQMEGKPNRIVYNITPAGRKLFVALLREVPDAQLHSREDFFMRLYFFSYLDEATRLRILDSRASYLIQSRQKAERATGHGASSPELMEFHLHLLKSECELIERYRSRVHEPTLMDDEGNPI